MSSSSENTNSLFTALLNDPNRIDLMIQQILPPDLRILTDQLTFNKMIKSILDAFSSNSSSNAKSNLNDFQFRLEKLSNRKRALDKQSSFLIKKSKETDSLIITARQNVQEAFMKLRLADKLHVEFEKCEVLKKELEKCETEEKLELWIKGLETELKGLNDKGDRLETEMERKKKRFKMVREAALEAVRDIDEMR